MGGGVGGEPKAGSSIHLTRKTAILGFAELHCTNSHRSLVSCLTPSVALLVCPSGTVA